MADETGGWYVVENGNPQGPMSLDELAARVSRQGPGAMVYRKVPPRYGEAQVRVEEEPDVLFTPYLPPHTPILPGSATLPGYYGSTHSYEYQGPYYGGPYVGYWDRLPYACGVYGYC